MFFPHKRENPDAWGLKWFPLLLSEGSFISRRRLATLWRRPWAHLLAERNMLAPLHQHGGSLATVGRCPPTQSRGDIDEKNMVLPQLFVKWLQGRQTSHSGEKTKRRVLGENQQWVILPLTSLINNTDGADYKGPSAGKLLHKLKPEARFPLASTRNPSQLGFHLHISFLFLEYISHFFSMKCAASVSFL